MKESTIEALFSQVPEGLEIIKIGDPLYHYARVISNTRFGHMPSLIAYCEKVEHVQFCVQFCEKYRQEFRVRSGGHQHEGMSSKDDAFIIDLSKMNKITYDHENKGKAWIPVGMQLGKVYDELETIGRIIPGGGCQSVNVGGLTQGGGWGVSIRKFGFTCDAVIECEIVLAGGSVVRPSKTTKDPKLKELFWALKGGGGGNFGVVTRFKFKLSKLAPVMTVFGMEWKEPHLVKKALKIWTYLHALPVESGGLDTNLSTACRLMVAKPSKEDEKEMPKGDKSVVYARMGGMFYGNAKDLKNLLKKHFKEELIADKYFTSITEKITGNVDISLGDVPLQINGESAAKRAVKAASEIQPLSLASHQNVINDFLNPMTSLDESKSSSKCSDRGYGVLPGAPNSTCDRPHPHKISSSFPKAKKEEDHHALVDAIYNFLAKTCFYSDVVRYMSFHCLGGAVQENVERRVFAYHDKPYLLQIQCWWDDASNLFANESRNKEYVKWVKEFREALAKYTEGSFINFVDYSLVEDPETEKGRLDLLAIYYGWENLNRLRAVKSEFDKKQVFKFKMSIPPSS